MAATAITLKLVKGGLSLDLNSGRYTVGRDFKPPTLNVSPLIATGTSANRYGEGQRVDRSFSQRTWSFEIRIVATSEAEGRIAVRDLAAMLERAGDESEPLYVHYKPNSDTPEPVWGQYGANIRYKVIDGNPGDLWDQYAVSNVRNGRIILTVVLVIDALALGKTQAACSAVGGVLEVMTGSTDGQSQGLSVPEATTNLHTNPVFGHATYDNGWTAGSNLIKKQVTDTSFLPFGYSGVLLNTKSTTNNHFTQSITLTAATYRLSYYVYSPDRSAISSTQVQVSYDGVAQSSTYTSLGNGLYVVEASVTGTAAAHTCGIVVKQSGITTVIIVGAQCELKGYRTPLAHGDMLGCAWSGTAHASSTTRTAARVSLATAGLFGASPFTIRAVWRSGANLATGLMILDSRDGSYPNGMRLEINSGLFRLYYSGVSVNSVGAVAAYTTYVFHLVYNGSSIALYVNNVTSGISLPVTLSDQGASLFIGTDYSTANHSGGEFKGAAIFDRALSATEISNDYTNIAAVLNSSSRLDAVPWLWTIAGNNMTSQYSDASNNHYAICGGVPGTYPAQTEFYIGLDATASGDFDADGRQYNLALLDVDDLVMPWNAVEYADVQGLPTTAADVGSEVGVYSTSDAGSASAPGVTLSKPRNWLGREVMVFMRLSDAGTGLQMAATVTFGTNTMSSDWQSLAADATRRGFFIGPIYIPDAKSMLFASTFTSNFTVATRRIRSAGSGLANLSIDYVFIVPTTLIQVKAQTATSSISGVSSHLIGFTATINDAADKFDHHPTVTGRQIELSPSRFNILFAWRGAHGSPHVITRKMTFNSVKVTPRYGIL